MAKSPVKLFLIFLILYFINQAAKYYSGHDLSLVFECILILFLLMILFAKYQKYRFSNASMLLVFILLFVHSLGIYNLDILNIPIDRFIHFTGAFAAALIISQMRQASDKSVFSSGFYTVLITLGLASLLEITNYMTNLLLNYNGSLLGYTINGLGDCANSNSIRMLVNHLLGAVCGAVLGEFNRNHHQMQN